VENTVNSELLDNSEELRKKLSEKISELEQMYENIDNHTTDEINAKLEGLSELQKDMEKHHESMYKANEKKQKAIDELEQKIKKMKELQNAVDKEYGIKEENVKNDRRKRIYRKKRTHRDYKLSINHTALKNLEGITQSSFLALAKCVILIEGKPYSNKDLTPSTERKNDFRRLIEHYAMLDFIGQRKCCIRQVYNKKQRGEMNVSEIPPPNDNEKNKST
jgi:phosphoglycerate-specific signal transduction histidine kinase